MEHRDRYSGWLRTSGVVVACAATAVLAFVLSTAGFGILALPILIIGLIVGVIARPSVKRWCADSAALSVVTLCVFLWLNGLQPCSPSGDRIGRSGGSENVVEAPLQGKRAEWQSRLMIRGQEAMREDGSRDARKQGPAASRTRANRHAAAVMSAALLAVIASIDRAGGAGEPERVSGTSGDQAVSPGSPLSAEWRAQFWRTAEAQALLRLGPKAAAEMVPVQSGARFCRCPACDAEERDDPLVWSIEHPSVLKCRRCGLSVPNERFPARVNKEIPEETVEVLPGVVHHYPYHSVEEARARYPEERLYFRAKLDYEARKYLARAALYCAAESSAQLPDRRDARMAAIACAIILRFAQVYPAYATHLDLPGKPKLFQPARLEPPYRRGYRTARWEWTGSLEVPMNLVAAYSLLRGDPAWAEAGRLLGDRHPERTVESDLFRAAAEYVLGHPDEFSEESIHVDRGLLAVGRLLDDRRLQAEALTRLEGLMRRGFYHDGFWKGGGIEAHRRVLGLLEGAIGETSLADSSVRRASRGLDRDTPDSSPATGWGSLLELARQATAAAGPRSPDEPVQRASTRRGGRVAASRRPILLGGAGLARLAIGEGQDAIDLELRGPDSYRGAQFARVAIRLAIAGRPVLDDLDERASTGTGWEMATPSHNTVVVDGLNQRETPTAAATPAAGSNFLFFAADPDFQVATVDDPRAYPQSTTRYRQTIILTASRRSRYAVSVFEVRGGLQHDQIFHAAPGSSGRWRLSVPTRRPPPSLLPPSIRFLRSARPEQGRWFVQSYGEFRLEDVGEVTSPALAGLVAPGPTRPSSAPVIRASDSPPSDAMYPPELMLHLLGDPPVTAFTATSPDPTIEKDAPATMISGDGRASLILRRRSRQGEILSSVFVTLFEPCGGDLAPLRRVGRVDSSPDVVVVLVETIDGPEYLLVNLDPSSNRHVQLPSGRYVSFDGLALRVREDSLVMAGGRIAEGSGKLLSQSNIAGTLSESVRRKTERGRGWFLSADRLPADPAVAGRTLVVQHGDGSFRSWTLDSIESTAEGTRLHVREEPGFSLEGSGRKARYYQFPQTTAPGPHRFRLCQICR
jgi:hypothetical protein